jgi:hypothetical protein
MNLQEVIDDIADQLVAAIEGLEVERSVSAWKWRSNQDAGLQLPSAVVQVPEFDRSDLDGAEDHLGARDLRMEFAVPFFFDLGQTDASFGEGIEVVSAFVDALDADPGLDGHAQEAKVTHTEPANSEPLKGRPTFAFICTVSVLAFF